MMTLETMLKGPKSDVEIIQHLIVDPSTSDLRSITILDAESVGHPMKSPLNEERPRLLKIRCPSKK